MYPASTTGAGAVLVCRGTAGTPWAGARAAILSPGTGTAKAHHAPEVLDEHYLVDGRGRFGPRTERDGRPPSRVRIEAARVSPPFP